MAVRRFAVAVGLVAVLCCTLSWAGAQSLSVATRAIPEVEQPVDASGVAELDDTPRFACDGSKSAWAQMAVTGIAVRFAGDARGSSRPLEARTSIAAYRYTSAFRSRAPPQRA